jgi:Inner membrane component of T3SS, cytoplasmic domain
MPFVIITKEKQGPGAEKVKTVEVSGTSLRIGRGTDNDLHLDDHSVQLHHAIIQEVDDGYVLRDRNILSLTSVNDVPVNELVLPEAGTIRIGPYTLRFTRHTPSSPLTVEYEVLADVGPGTPIAPEALSTLGAHAPGDARVKGTAPPATAALGGLSPSPPSIMRDEKFHLVAAYKLQGRYFNKTTMTVLAVLVVFGGSALVWALGKHTAFMPGSISLKHRLFANDCVRCHAAGKPVLAVVPDQTCLRCHSGPPHFSDRALSPAPQCATCHIEHKGQALAALSDSTCLQCHTDLKVTEARIPIATTIHSFTADHPEFAITVSPLGQHTAQRVRLNERERVVDTAAIKLNHRLHLKADLMGPNGPEQLSCASCHQANSQGAYMRPVKYETHCMRCHFLDFDERLPEKVVPHGQSLEEIDRFLRTTYAEYYVLQHQPEVKAPGFARRLPGVTRSKEVIWIDAMVEEAEQLLMGPPGSRTSKGKCVLCHMLVHQGGASLPAQVDRAKSNTPGSASRILFPTVVKTAMPERWLPYSIFDHKAHNIFQCVACHEAAPRSERTQEVLLPGIGSCQYCHFEPGGARAQCLTCHVYHDKSQDQKPGDQPYSIEQFRGQASLLSGPADLSSP